MIWMALLPTKMPRIMKMVAGFHGFAAGLVDGELVRERRDLGRREVQKVGCATRGRLDSSASRVSNVAEKGRDCICRLTHVAQMVCSGLNALEGAIVM